MRWLLATLALLPAPLRADAILECSEPGITAAAIAECLDRTAEGTERALSDAASIAAADASDIEEMTGESAVGAFEASQAAWSAWRDAECAYREALFGDGPGPALVEKNCRIRLARDRIGALLGR